MAQQVPVIMRILFVEQVEYIYALESTRNPVAFLRGPHLAAGRDLWPGALTVYLSRKFANNPAVGGPSGKKAIYGWTLINNDIALTW